jgi:hypothetical protein
MLTVWKGMQYRRSQKGTIPYLIVLHSNGGLESLMLTRSMLSFKCRMADYYSLYTTVHYTILYTIHCYLHEEFIYILHRSVVKG